MAGNRFDPGVPTGRLEELEAEAFELAALLSQVVQTAYIDVELKEASIDALRRFSAVRMGAPQP